MRKSLFCAEDFNEIAERILQLNANSKRKWGSMDVSGMLVHCDKILQIPTGKLHLPKLNPVVKFIGALTKMEMRVFNNGIPPNMPTFRAVKIENKCNFEEARKNLLKQIEEFLEVAERGELPDEHELFGKMTKEDWGFMEYKHLNHHLKQFGV